MGNSKQAKQGALAASLPPGKSKTHGGYTFLATGKLPEHRREVLAYLSGARVGLIKDLGPTEQNLTAAQIILIDRTVTALGIVRCIEEHIRENSVMRGQDVAPALKQSYLAYVNHIRLNLAALGIATKAGEGVLDLSAYIREHDTKSQPAARKAHPGVWQGQGEAEGQGEDSGAKTENKAGPEIIEPGATSSDVSGHNKALIDSGAESGQDQGSEGGGIGQPSGLHSEGATDETVLGGPGEKDDPGATHEV